MPALYAGIYCIVSMFCLNLLWIREFLFKKIVKTNNSSNAKFGGLVGGFKRTNEFYCQVQAKGS